MHARRAALIVVFSAAVLSGRFPHSDGHRHLHAQQALPELSYICPMTGDEEVNEGKPGRCPKCGMDLVPARIDQVWSCPTHAVVMESKPGKCRFDGRELMPVIVTMHWECADQPKVRLGDPGTCANGTERRLVRELRAHADHNPRHGGLFFMAADQWHHLEGTYPRAGLFRLFMYDNFTKPYSVKGMSGRVVTREENGRELETFPLTAGPDGTTLDAGLKTDTLPLKAVVKVKFDAKTPEQRFDFAFTEYSKEPVPGTPSTTAAARPSAPAAGAAKPTGAAATPSTPPASAPAAAAAAAPAPTPALSPPASPGPVPDAPSQPAVVEVPAGSVEPAANALMVTDCKPNLSRADALLLADNLPRSSAELVKLLTMCSDEVGALIQNGQFGFVYQPTILSKDIALALEAFETELNDRQRKQATIATKDLVIAAWELDYYGDLGNREKLTETFQKYAAAAAEIKTAYGSQ